MSNMSRFLPEKPIACLPEWHHLEDLMKELPFLISSRKLREEVIYVLRKNPVDIFSLKTEFLERGMLIFSYLASAYIHAKHETTQTRLPKEIAKPLVTLASLVRRLPILSYASYCLHNWAKIDITKPPLLDNIKLLQNFSSEFKKDEDGFILIHVAIEYEMSRVIDKLTINNLEDILIALQNINTILDQMYDYCNPNVYYNEVRPYIFGFNNVIYEDCFVEPRTYRGETGAQSTILPVLVKFFGIKHTDTLLTKHLDDMKNYMPVEHRQFLKSVTSIREEVTNSDLKKLYNDCIMEIVKFRKKHLEYAINYIHNKTDNPQGTGGTPYIPWLSKLIDETNESFF